MPRRTPSRHVAAGKLGVGLRLTLGVPEGARLLDVVFDLGEAAAVGEPQRSR
jgi:hypothetical protein